MEKLSTYLTQLSQQLGIGNTPLTLLCQNEHGTKILVKEEYHNATGSIKDRAALYMILEAMSRDALKKGDTVVEATSGNTGIALAYVCGKFGIKTVLTMPETMSVERRQMLQQYGATLELTEGKLGMSGAVARAKSLAQSGAFEVRQFDNPANITAHYMGTGQEILRDTDNQVDVFVAAVGTGGTLCGTAQRLSEVVPSVQIIAVEPAESAVLSGKAAGAHGIQGIGAGFVPTIVDKNLIDGIMTVTTQQAYDMAVRLNKQFGRPCGISSGANVYAAMQLFNDKRYYGKTIVTVLPDSVNRYLSVLKLD